MGTTQSKYGRRFDEEFKREVAALASRPGAKQEQVAHDLGVSPYSVSRWKKLYGGLGTAELRLLKQLEDENRKLKQLVADLSLDKHILQDVLSRKL